MNDTIPDKYVEKVKELHELIGYQHEDRPSLGSEAQRALWVRLIREEAEELLAAIENEDFRRRLMELRMFFMLFLGPALRLGYQYRKYLPRFTRAIYQRYRKKRFGGKMERCLGARIINHQT
jgi:hypothetical protein